MHAKASLEGYPADSASNQKDIQKRGFFMYNGGDWL
jgi:hypothetical protein